MICKQTIAALEAETPLTARRETADGETIESEKQDAGCATASLPLWLAVESEGAPERIFAWQTLRLR